MFGFKVKSLRKSEWVLVWSGPITAVTGMWAMTTKGGIPLLAFIVAGVITIFSAMWHAIDKDIVIKD